MINKIWGWKKTSVQIERWDFFWDGCLSLSPNSLLLKNLDFWVLKVRGKKMIFFFMDSGENGERVLWRGVRGGSSFFFSFLLEEKKAQKHIYNYGEIISYISFLCESIIIWINIHLKIKIGMKVLNMFHYF